MTGYWPSSFLLLPVYGPKWRPISSHLDETSLVNKGFTHFMEKEHQDEFLITLFSCGKQRVIPSGQDIEPSSQSQRSARGASHIVRKTVV